MALQLKNFKIQYPANAVNSYLSRNGDRDAFLATEETPGRIDTDNLPALRNIYFCNS